MLRNGFEVVPQQLNLGDLCEGGVYRLGLVLVNTSQNMGRFRLGRRGRPAKDAAEPEAGFPASEPGCDSVSHRIRVVYQPGALAAGMKRNMEVEVAALTPAAGASATPVDDFVEIIAEKQVIRVPVVGRVVAAAKHDRRRVGKQARLFSKV